MPATGRARWGQGWRRLVCSVAAALITSAARTEPAPYFAGKEIRLLISHPPGGGYDAYARLFARHLPGLLPGAPGVVAQNMPGAAGLVMANYMASQAPRDGTVIALGPGSLATAALFGAKGARYDAGQLTWIGSLNSEVGVAVAWKTAPVKTAADLFTQELVVAGAGNTDQSVVYPTALNRLLGTKFKVISGYGGSNETALALARGEVAGIGGWNYSSMVATHPDWLRNGDLSVLLQLALTPHPDLPAVPTVLELARDAGERDALRLVFAPSAIGRVIFAPPGVPAPARDALVAAFAAMVRDTRFLAEARRVGLEINDPMPGPAVARLVSALIGTPPALVQRAARAIAADP